MVSMMLPQASPFAALAQAVPRRPGAFPSATSLPAPAEEAPLPLLLELLRLWSFTWPAETDGR